jgi:hypothetical protein
MDIILISHCHSTQLNVVTVSSELLNIIMCILSFCLVARPDHMGSDYISLTSCVCGSESCGPQSLTPGPVLDGTVTTTTNSRGKSPVTFHKLKGLFDTHRNTRIHVEFKTLYNYRVITVSQSRVQTRRSTTVKGKAIGWYQVIFYWPQRPLGITWKQPHSYRNRLFRVHAFTQNNLESILMKLQLFLFFALHLPQE